MIQENKKALWASADKLRANMDAAEYKHLVLGLIFLKYISDTFTAHRAEVEARLRDPEDEYYYGDAADEDIAAELEDRDYYTEANIFWVPEGARWEVLRKLGPAGRHRPPHRRRALPGRNREPEPEGHSRQAFRPGPVAGR